jgi:predicted DCC family thiol-disulfide oxidoreductase YuxK
LEQQDPIILFDGVCNFCNRMVNFAIRNDKKAKLKFAPLQSTTGQELLKQFNVSPGADTVVLISKGKAYTYANAAIRICKWLDWPAKMMYAFIIIPSFISQPSYKWFARHRYKWFGKKETCMVPAKEVRERFLD